MQDAVTDGLQHPMVSRLSGIQSGQHAHGSLVHLLKENPAALDDICPVPGSAQDQMLPLSSIIRRVYQYYPTEFVHRLGADVGRTRSFWEQLSRQENQRHLREHHYLRNLTIDELTYVVPLVLHEDAAPVTKLLSANMISVSSILGLGNKKLTHFLLATHIKRNKSDSEDHTPLWNAIFK